MDPDNPGYGPKDMTALTVRVDQTVLQMLSTGEALPQHIIRDVIAYLRISARSTLTDHTLAGERR